MAKQRKECVEYSVNTKDKVCETSYKFNKVKPKIKRYLNSQNIDFNIPLSANITKWSNTFK